MLEVRLLDKVGRKGKIKIRFEDGPHPGLEEYISTRQLAVTSLVTRAAYDLDQSWG
jgi:hypothetical protein